MRRDTPCAREGFLHQASYSRTWQTFTTGELLYGQSYNNDIFTVERQGPGA